ncbi:MAG: VWA domain-containing protein [Verrucomicrobia bacterium]|nr:VWA domain-containing protein [Verrucomicrobiota bacterium]
MRFAEPVWLFGFVFIPIFLVVLWAAHKRARCRLEKLLPARLASELTDSVARVPRLIQQFCFFGAIACVLIALARPQLGYIDQQMQKRSRDILLAIDTSKSMMSTDVAPDRLTRAKLLAQDLMTAMRGDRFGLIAFAGAAQVEAPLTIDFQTVTDSVNELNTNTVERGGTNISAAIKMAELVLGKTEGVLHALVLVTDGEDLEGDSIAAAKEAAKSGIRIFTVGVGTPSGAPIPVQPGRDQYLQDESGEIVISHLDERRLKELASETGGFYTHLDRDTVDVLTKEGFKSLAQTSVDQRVNRRPIERYRWPLLAGFVLLLLSMIMSDRKKRPALPVRKLSVMTLLFLLSVEVHADSALDHYNHGDYTGALDLLRSQLKEDQDSAILNFNAGDAAFRLKKYDQAFESYAKAMNSQDPDLREKAFYNAGNALFVQGNNTRDIERKLSRYYDARYQYGQALDINPQDEQARKNLSLLEQRIKEAEERKKQEEQQKKRQKPRRKQNKKRQNQPGNQNPDQMQQPGDQPDDDDSSDSSQQQSPDAPESGEMDDSQDDTGSQKKEGQIQENTTSDDNGQQNREELQTRSGQMTQDEAQGLLDSLKDEGSRIDLTRHKTERGVFRDW